MATGEGLARLLDRHKDKISELDFLKVLPSLCHKSLFTPEEELCLRAESNRTKRTETFINLIAKKGFGAFQEFCMCLETVSPQLLTSLLLENNISGKWAPVFICMRGSALFSSESRTSDAHSLCSKSVTWQSGGSFPTERPHTCRSTIALVAHIHCDRMHE